MKKSVSRNYIYNLIYQILVLILPLITTPYVSRVLGATNIGIYSYTVSISALFILFGSLGVALYGQREIAYLQEDTKKRTIAFLEIVIFRSITLLISLVVFYFMFVRGNNDYNIYYQGLTLEIIATAFDISWFFMGIEEFNKTVGRNIFIKLLSLILIFTLVKSESDLIIYFWIYVLSILLGNLSLWLYLPKYLEKVKIRELNIFRHIKPTLALFIPQIAIQVYTILDRTMIGTIIVDKSEVGYYDQAQKIIKLILAIITSMGTVMMPRIASTFAKGNKKTVENYMEKSFNMVFFLAFPMIMGIIATSKRFVPIFFGPGYDKIMIIMNVISPIILLIGLSNVMGTQYLLPTKRQKQYSISVICGSVVNVLMNLALIHKYGAVGASVGTVLAELSVTLVQMYYTRNDFKWHKILSIPGKYILASIIMFLICLIVPYLIKSNFVCLITQVLLGSIVYFGILILLKDKFLIAIMERFLKPLRKKFNMVKE